MGFLSGLVKGIGKAVSTVVKTGSKVVGGVIKATPGVGQIYQAATSLVGLDPVEALGNTIASVTGGGNIGNDIKAGLNEALIGSGGLVGVIFPSALQPGEELPQTSADPPGVYTYADGSYAYTVNNNGTVSYNPSDLTNPPVSGSVAPNGSITPIPASLSAKAVYVQTLLDSYSNPLGVDKANMTMSAVNNFVTGQNPLDGVQQSNLIALDVINKDPEALSYTAQALSQATGKSAVDWIAILTGLWNTAKVANIPGVSDTVKRIEGEILVPTVTNMVEETIVQKISRFIKDNMLLVFGGAVGIILLIVFLSGRSRR
ncbi:hypothetical protein M2451_002030 [Dysgonomonas sp. PFB1-18]|uniref:hypothetical protein n=1 Tax=unclassified Dysgonomonas TaxID=2630389 RepID=UPI002476512A|nr:MULTISPECIES: hypothetical protein [unclassified Dysgonomonas]MDH6309786.1 hypothetical protein [Dysgonomonas sp. PF1-14]MDH6339206.1 hypothetical protein [Dysgonomonas sp. PF1-16]MDH6380705.1 hypothetical protein [Dysgonomonas sp. PFB1-18]MDH6398201.1 hypothetical protein [Dysgonomonas sp. PF1-23]